jgi:hypothetical protein
MHLSRHRNVLARGSEITIRHQELLLAITLRILRKHSRSSYATRTDCSKAAKWSPFFSSP